MNKLSIIPIILIISIIVLQFFLPFSTSDGKNYNSFESYNEFKEIHWGFYFIFFILILSIIGLIFYVLHLFEKHSFSFAYDTSLWFLAFVLIIIFMWQLQYYLRDYPSTGVKENSTSAATTLMIVIALFFVSLFSLFSEQQQRGLKKLATKTSNEFNNEIKDKKILYTNTVIINPKITVEVFHPFPKKLAVTDEEIIIDTKPLTKIHFDSIKEIKFEKGVRVSFKIILSDGMSFNVMWGPTNVIALYNFDKTLEICNVLNSFLAQHKKK